MSTSFHDTNHRSELRSRAVAHLKGLDAQVPARTNAADALGVRYDLASSPATAHNALALLHELQVHQVEVELQDEEMRRSRAELETSLARQVQLYDFAPVGYFTVDDRSVLRELNRTGASLLGCEPDAARGRQLESFLTPDGVSNLRALLRRVTESALAAWADLELRAAQDGQPRAMRASVCLDPAGGGFLIAMIG